MEHSRRERFAKLYRATHPEVLGFVARRLSPSDASDRTRIEDITHEVFLVAWRRFDDVPHELDEARA